MKIVAERIDLELQGEFELEKNLHLDKATIKTTKIKVYPLYHFKSHLEIINFNLDYLETIIYELDPL